MKLDLRIDKIQIPTAFVFGWVESTVTAPDSGIFVNNVTTAIVGPAENILRAEIRFL